MIFDNIYKNTITFSSTGNIELDFTDNKSEIRYLLDIIIDDNIIINNVFSIGTSWNIGTIINNSPTTIGISLDSTSVTLVLDGSHSVGVKIKQGIILAMKTASVNTPSAYDIVPVGYSFNAINGIMTETDHSNYEDGSYNPFMATMLIDVNSLLDSNEQLVELYTPYSHDNNTYPMFAYTDKLIADTAAETGKNKKISTLIDDASIPSALFIDSNLERVKMEDTVRDSIDLGDIALQNIYTNSNITAEEKIGLAIDLNLATAIKGIKRNDIDYYTYATDASGIGTVDYLNTDGQSKILNTNEDGKSYFISYLTGGEYGYEDMELFFKKDDNIKYGENTIATDDLLYSSMQMKALLFNKVDVLDPLLVPIGGSGGTELGAGGFDERLAAMNLMFDSWGVENEDIYDPSGEGDISNSLTFLDIMITDYLALPLEEQVLGYDVMNDMVSPVEAAMEEINNIIFPSSPLPVFVEFSINTQGQITEGSLVERSSLSDLLDDHYKRSNFSNVMNTSSSTIFFI